MTDDLMTEVPQPVRRRGRPGYDAEQLLAVAVTVFTQRGYDGTSMDDLATALGLSKSSIYHHVSGKKELLARALGRALDRLEAVVDEAAADEDRAPLQRIETAVRRSVQVLVEDLPFVTLLLRVRGNSDIERSALLRRRRLDGQLAELVQAAQRDGDVDPTLDPQLLARLVFGAVNSLTEWYRPGRGLEPTRIADTLSQLVFRGIRAGS